MSLKKRRIMMSEITPINVVSFCIPERNEVLEDNAIENAKLLSKVFPEWKGYFYIKSDVDESVVKAISEQPNCSAFVLDSEVRIDSDFWQYVPLTEGHEVSAFVSRDCNELITDHDYSLVSQWLDTPQQFFCIRESKDPEESPIRRFHWGGRLNGPVNTMWLFYYLSQSEFLTKNPDYPKDSMLISFYNGFRFLFVEFILTEEEEEDS
jgi:hypothetical protein